MLNTEDLLRNLQIPCLTTTITSDKTSYSTGDVITLAVTTEPVPQPGESYTIFIIDQYGNYIGTCTTTTGTCTIDWDTKGFSSGTYTIRAQPGWQCFNMVPLTITLQPPYVPLLIVAAISIAFAVTYREIKHRKEKELGKS